MRMRRAFVAVAALLLLDAISWKSVHGADATPPPPGPNADPENSNTDPEG